MGFFKKKDTIILQNTQPQQQQPQQQQPYIQPQQLIAEHEKETNLHKKEIETLNEKTKLLKEHIDNIREAFKLREEALQRIIDLMKELKNKQEKQETTIQKIEEYLKANTDDYSKNE